MNSRSKVSCHLRVAPFIVGGLLYALVYGSCDYNYWGAWVLDLRDFLDLPFPALLEFSVRHSSSPESSHLVFFHYVAVLMNAHIYGLLLSLVMTRFAGKTKTEPNQTPHPTPL
jgi:hypothetical protein